VASPTYSSAFAESAPERGWQGISTDSTADDLLWSSRIESVETTQPDAVLGAFGES
jgi:hypothetical protein